MSVSYVVDSSIKHTVQSLEIIQKKQRKKEKCALQVKLRILDSHLSRVLNQESSYNYALIMLL